MSISVVVLTVPRDGSYFKITAEHLDAQHIPFTASVGANTDIYNGRNVVFAPESLQPNFDIKDFRYRVHCNYVNALLLPIYAHEEYRLILEDDVIICNDFMSQLEKNISMFKEKSMGVLSLYNPYAGNKDNDKLSYFTENVFMGTQSILYPKELLVPFAQYIKENILRLPYDLLLAEFCIKNGYKIWHSPLSLVHCRVGTEKPYKIQLNRKRLLSANVTPDYVYALIVWAYIRRENLDNDNFFCDQEALLHCISVGKNKKNILQGWNTVFIEVPTEQNVSRMTKLMEQVKATKDGEAKGA